MQTPAINEAFASEHSDSVPSVSLRCTGILPVACGKSSPHFHPVKGSCGSPPLFALGSDFCGSNEAEGVRAVLWSASETLPAALVRYPIVPARRGLHRSGAYALHIMQFRLSRLLLVNRCIFFESLTPQYLLDSIRMVFVRIESCDKESTVRRELSFGTVRDPINGFSCGGLWYFRRLFRPFCFLKPFALSLLVSSRNASFVRISSPAVLF